MDEKRTAARARKAHNDHQLEKGASSQERGLCAIASRHHQVSTSKSLVQIPNYMDDLQNACIPRELYAALDTETRGSSEHSSAPLT